MILFPLSNALRQLSLFYDDLYSSICSNPNSTSIVKKDLSLQMSQANEQIESTRRIIKYFESVVLRQLENDPESISSIPPHSDGKVTFILFELLKLTSEKCVQLRRLVEQMEQQATQNKLQTALLSSRL